MIGVGLIKIKENIYDLSFEAFIFVILIVVDSIKVYELVQSRMFIGI